LCRNLRSSKEKVPHQSVAAICPEPKIAVPHGPTLAAAVGQRDWKEKNRDLCNMKKSSFAV